MARIQIEWVTWRKPTKLGADAYEDLRSVLCDSGCVPASYEDLRAMLHEKSLGRRAIIEQLQADGRLYGSAMLAFLLCGLTEGVGKWLKQIDHIGASISFWVFMIGWVVVMMVCSVILLGFWLRLMIYWPSILLYVRKNRSFVSRRLRAIQQSKNYEEYLSLE